jgi:hypothetical protein
MSLLVSLRIAVFCVDIDIWCDICTAPCAVTIIYTIESRDGGPTGVYRLTYCEVCDARGVKGW